MNKQKGITLIALIITIIVMLILVGVTVATALNGGLFAKSKDASKKTQLESDLERLQAIAVGTMGNDGKVNFGELNEKAEELGFTTVANGTYTKDGNTFIVSENGGVTAQEAATGDLADLENYFIGKNLNTLNPDPQYGGKFEDNPETEINETESIIYLNIVEGFDTENSTFYVKYNNKGYRVVSKYENNAKICNKVELVYEPQGREGERVAYDSNNDGTDEEWMILYDNGDNIEMVSMENMGTLELGYNDAEAQTPGDVDNDENENTDLDKAIYSYNNAITRLNTYCASLVTNENKISVRSVGSNPSNPSSENTTPYTSENLANWEEGKYNGIGKSGDTNLEQDLVRMSYYGITATGENYWMASRCVGDGIRSSYFSVCGVDLDGNFAGYDTFGLYDSSGSGIKTNVGSNINGIRPVIKITSDVI